MVKKVAARRAAPKKGRKKLSPAEKATNALKRLHMNAVRRVFTGAGFHRVPNISDKEFTFEGRTSDFDDVFVNENVVTLVEYTISQAGNVGDHLKNKKIIYDKILGNKAGFLSFLAATFPEAAALLPKGYHSSKVILKIVYCSYHDFDQSFRDLVPGPVYLNYPAVRYFDLVVAAIKRSARYELLHFMDIPLNTFGAASNTVAQQSKNYTGSLLPEAHSHFDDGYKIVSFYTEAEALLRTAYVLRRDGWRSSDNVYQRMINAKKIERIRVYLKNQKRVFINNIIVTLPSDVQPLHPNTMQPIDSKTLTSTAAITIQLPDRANTIGIIDGQHRVFAYHETAVDDAEIAQLRKQQNLLVTGIIYPQGTSTEEREKFEANLFLEINSNQTSANPQLKQAIGLVIDPYTNDSIATRVLNGLARQGPLGGLVQQYLWDVDKLKTASIVSYGMRPLVKTGGTDSLFAVWNHADKQKVAEGKDIVLLQDYIKFCVTTINTALGAIKANLAAEKWTADKKVAGSVISTTYINSFLIVLRLLIEQGASLEFVALQKSLAGLDKFPFASYRSSQYRRMAEAIVKKHFSASAAAAPPPRQPTPSRATGR